MHTVYITLPNRRFNSKNRWQKTWSYILDIRDTYLISFPFDPSKLCMPQAIERHQSKIFIEHLCLYIHPQAVLNSRTRYMCLWWACFASLIAFPLSLGLINQIFIHPSVNTWRTFSPHSAPQYKCSFMFLAKIPKCPLSSLRLPPVHSSSTFQSS